MTVEICLLGSVGARSDGSDIDLGGPRQRRLLAALALSPGVVVDASRLIDVVWADGELPVNPRETLRTYVSRLRTQLGGPHLVAGRAGGYALAVSPSAVDASLFEDLLRRCLGTDGPRGPEKVAALAAALRLWRGPALSGVDGEEWARPAAVRLAELHATACDEFGQAQIEVGALDDAVATLQAASAEHPLRERTHRLLMSALYRSGRQAEALRTYNSYRRRLATDLGLEPGDEIRRLEERIATSAPDGTTAPAGDVPLRGYEIHERIGGGSFAVVYRGFQPSVQRDVAIKEIRAELADRPEFIRRFEAEAHLVARLEHPHIVPLYDYWREPARAFLVMRWFRNGSLEDALANGPWDLEHSVALVRQIGSALSHAHRAGVVHRDVKPANILLDDHGNAYLGDFGIAHGIDVSRSAITSTSAGSPAYSAPEQSRRGPVGPTADVYALAVVLHELLTNRLPQRSDEFDTLAVGGAMSSQALVIDSSVPDTIAAVIEHATRAEPQLRMQSIDEFVSRLDAMVGRQSVSSASGDDRSGERVVGTDNPFKGLRSFDEADAVDFFGRDSLVAQVLRRIGGAGHTARFTAVIGPSGSGKSSLVRAGVLPAVRAGAIDGSQEWFVASMVPGVHPFAELESALKSLATNSEGSVIDRSPQDASSILTAVRRTLGSGRELLLFIDQFEEIFTMVVDEDERREFLDALARAVTSAASQTRVVVTLRADFYDRPLRYPSVARLVSDGAVTVTPLTTDELEAAITSPARRAGVSFEPGLVAELMADTVNQPGALPMLQFTLTELFDCSRNAVLRIEDYNRLGRLSGALASSADRLYVGASPESQLAIHRLMARLVTFGEGSEDTRRRVVRSELVTDRDTVDVIEAYGRARLLSFDRHPTTREPTVEVAHEALIRHWPRLREWIDEDRVGLRLHRQLTATSEGWKMADRDTSELFRGARLAATEEWATVHAADLNVAEREFLDASLAARHSEQDGAQRLIDLQKLQNRRLRRSLVAAGVALAMALIAGTIAFAQRNRAEDQRTLADQRAAESDAARADAAQQRDNADIDRMVAQSTSDANEDPVRSVLFAVEAARRRPGDWRTAGAIQSVLAQQPKGNLGQISGTIGIQNWDYGSKFIVGNDGSALVIWDAVTRKKLRSVEIGAIVYPNSVELSDDEQYVAVSDSDGVTIVATETAERAGRVAIDGVPRIGGFDPSDDSRVAVVTQAGTVLVANWRTGTTLWRVDDLANGFDGSFDPSGNTLVTSHTDGTLRMWNAGTGAPVREPLIEEVVSETGDAAAVIFVSDFSPDGTQFATAAWSGKAKVWRLADGANTATFDIPISPSPSGAAFIDDHTLLAQAGDIHRFDLRANTELATISSLAGFPRLSPDRRTVGAGGGVIEFHALDSRQLGARVSVPLPVDFDEEQSEGLYDYLTTDAHGRKIMSFEAGAYLFDVDHPEGGWRQLDFPGPGALAYAGFTRDGTVLLSVRTDAERGEASFRLWNPDSMQPIGAAVTARSSDAKPTFALSPDQRRLAVEYRKDTAPKPTIFVYDMRSGAIVNELHDLATVGRNEDPIYPWGMSFNVDSTQLAVGEFFGRGVFVWDLSGAEPLFGMLADNGTTVDFGRSATKLAVAGEAVQVFDTTTRRPVTEPSLGRVGVRVTTDPSGRLLLTDGTCLPLQETFGYRDLSLWDAATGLEIGKGFQLNCGFWIPDGSGFIGRDRTSVQIWDVDPAKWIETACAFAGRNLTKVEWERYGPKQPYRETCPGL